MLGSIVMVPLKHTSYQRASGAGRLALYTLLTLTSVRMAFMIAMAMSPVLLWVSKREREGGRKGGRERENEI